MRKFFFLFAALMLWAISAIAAPRLYTNVEKLTLSGNMPMTKQITVYGADIEGDVVINLPEGVTAIPATIPGADLTIDKGIDVQLIFDTTEDFTGEISFNVDGGDKVSVVSQNVNVPVKVATLAELLALPDGTFAMYTGEAIVTAVKENVPGVTALFWMQDETAGIRSNTTAVRLQYGLTENLAIGDKVTNVMMTKGNVEQQFSYNNLKENRLLKMVSHDNPVEAKLITSPEEFTKDVHNMLIVMKSMKFDATYDPFAANKVFAISGGVIEMFAQPYAALYGTEVPTDFVDITGVYTLPDPINLTESLVVRPRTAADFVKSEEIIPTVLISPLSIVKTPVKMGENTIVARYKVTVANLEEEGKISFGGEDATIFSATPSAIGTNNGTTEVEISAKATAVGDFKGTVKFDFGNELVNREYEISGSAYDPANMPEVTLNEYKVNMYAPVGESTTKQLTMTMANCIAPVEITAKDPKNTTVTIDKTTIEPTDQPVELTLIFTPETDGVGLQMFDIKTSMIKSQVVLVVNTTTDASVEVIASDSEGVFRVYNTAGVLVMETKDSASLQTLAPGLYIVNGRKLIIK